MSAFLKKLASLLNTLQIIPMSAKAWNQLEGYKVVTIGSVLAFFLGYVGSWAPPGSFILLCAIVSLITVTQHAEYKKHVIIKSRQYIAQNEMDEVQRRLKDIPSWVHFPDEEKAEWLNKILKKFWPFINRYVQDFMRQQVEPQVKDQLPSMLRSGFKFGAITLGRNAPRIAGVKTFVVERETANGRAREIIADLNWVYPGDCNIQMICTKIPTAGIQDLRVSGNLRVVMAPLLNKPPFIGAVTFFFKEPPSLDFNFTNAANLFDLPGLNEALRGLVRDQIDCRLTLPNRMVVPLCEDPEIDLVSLKHPMPEGIFRIGVIEAKELEVKDLTGKSDPYAVLKIGATKFSTKVIPRNVNPVWNEFFEAPVFYVEGQNLNVNLFDSDKTLSDEAMGNTTVGIKQFTQITNGFIDKWLPLSDASTGKIHILGSWLNLSDNPGDLRAAFQAQRLMPIEANNLNVAYLNLAIIGAKNLPKARDSSRNLDREDRPCPLVKIKRPGLECAKGQKDTTKVVWYSCEPSWQQGFDFFLSNPETDVFEFEVMDDSKSRKIIATASLCISDVMKAKQMRESFELELKTDAKYGFYSRAPSVLKVRATLRLLVCGGTERKNSKEFSGFGYEEPSSSREKSDWSTDDSGIGLGNLSSRSPFKGRRGSGTETVPQTPYENRKFGRNETAGKRFMSSLERKKSEAKLRNASVSGDMTPNPIRRGGSLSALSIGEPADTTTPVMNLGFNFNQDKNRLTVGVNEAKNLAVLFKELPNSYVSVQIKTSKPKQEQLQTTEVIAMSDHPRWYKALTFNCTIEQIDNSVITATLWNKGDKSPYGFVKLDAKELDVVSRSFWFPIKEKPEFVLPIEDPAPES